MDQEFAWDDLLDYVRDGELVTVLGSELLTADYEGRRVSLERLLAERLATREKLEVPWRAHGELNDVVSAYLERPRAKPADLYPRIARLLRELTPPFPVPPALEKLAEIRPLDLFVSVTFDALMAQALDRVRHAGKSATKQLVFSINQSTAAQTETLRERPSGADVVFSLFGRASSAADYAIHDEDALEFIHRFVSGDVAPPEWLLSELRNRHLLILGVHLPDWISRFVLRAATRDRLMTSQRAYFIASEAVAAGPTYTDFLQRFGRETRISIFDGPAAAFVDELHRRWLERVPAAVVGESQPPSPAEEHGRSIFISYGRENLAEVTKLHAAIEALGGDAWFDNDELNAGDRWEKKILPQIQREVRLFVPVISLRTALRDEGYVFREWREAVERAKKIVGRKFIVPVVVDADYQGTLDRYQSLVDEFPIFRELHFGRAPGGEPDEQLRAALNSEIRAMRRPETR